MDGNERENRNDGSRLIHGRWFEGNAISLKDIRSEAGTVIIVGKVFNFVRRDIRNGKSLVTFGITDLTDSIKVKIFVEQKDAPSLENNIITGIFLKIRGSVVFDDFDKELCLQRVLGIMTIPSFIVERKDTACEKRVELHCHTNMSDMDGISGARQLIEQAYKWGMPALAITDHAVVQGLTDGYHFICDYKKDHKESDIDEFKLILGTEGYLVDDHELDGIDINSPDDIEKLGKAEIDAIKRLPSSHVVILVKNKVGRTNLYKLVSESHLKFFYRKPLIPKSLLAKYRDGLIIGSACCAGELFKAVVHEWTDDKIKDIVDFYDYLEIQPIANNRFMIRDDNYPNVRSEEDLRALNREIVSLGEAYDKPVVATCDVHFLNPEDEIFRRVILTVRGMDEEPAPLYLRTTDEMLTEFSYLGESKAREVVIDNSRKISDMCGNIPSVRQDKCPPVIENSDETLRNVCYKRAHELYGNELPEIVGQRLKNELDAIIGNGYSALYIIGQKLVDKSLDEGYLVGSRGSVGSSFAAFTAGITEVNPLEPHYRCPKCKYSDFTGEDVIRFRRSAGYDMPDKNCPICGHPLIKDGFGIPFEVFMGVKGDKEPDIDLNFSGVIQGLIHKYTEEIFGEGNCFKAGTISTIAENTAYGFVKKYLEVKGISKRKAEIERMAIGCLGIKRSTGQHPGGIIVLPEGEDIYSFTPIQYPANDSDSEFITTHFDYHSIDHNLLKLDLLGHDDPTMLRFLSDCTGFDPKNVPFDDPKVMALFKGTDILGISPDKIGGTRVGCLGIPEFGTDFAMSMVLDAKPQSFSDLVRLSGLSHGTDVWLGNAKDLIDSGTATLSSCICCRDDIMTYLIEKGLDKQQAFIVMENARKGRIAKGKCSEWSDWKQDMIDHGIPNWYIRSCEKIKYMFPKAHAAAYVMMAWRIAYYKIYYPQAFYAAWFSIRAKKLDYEKMFMGMGSLKAALTAYRSKKYLTDSEKEEYAALRVVEEMYARGIEVEPINLSRVKASSFMVEGDKIMPSLTSIGGLGEKAAEMIIEEAKTDWPFDSIDEFKARTKCPQAVVKNMTRLGLLNDIPKELTLFDFMREDE